MSKRDKAGQRGDGHAGGQLILLNWLRLTEAGAGVKWIAVGSALARVALGAFLTGVREMMDQGSFRLADRACGFAEIEAHFDACYAPVTAEGLRL